MKGRAVVAALLGLAAMAWAGSLLNQVVDADESQHLHAAWLVAQGRAPYAEFWEHHAPLIYYLLAPLTRWARESPVVYPAGRALMAVTAAVALGVVYRLGARLAPAAGATAVVLLALQPRFVEHAVQIRPDVPALAASLLALWWLVRWREGRSPGHLWLAGVALGLAGAFTPKAAYAVPGIAAALALGGRDPGAAGRVAGALARIAAGAAGVLLALGAGLAWHGGGAAVAGFAGDVVLGGLRFVDFTKEGPVRDEGLGFVALALAGIGLAARRYRGGVVRHPVHGTLLLPLAATVVVLLLPRTPAVYRHAWLPVLAVGAVYAGLALSEVLARASTGRGWAGLAIVAAAVALVGPAAVSVRNGLRDENHQQLRVMRLLLRHTCPGEPVLDGTALYVFRPAAYRWGALVGGVREWVARGVIPEERIVEDVSATRPRVAYLDWRVRAFIGPLADFLARYYVPAPGGLAVLGATVSVPGGPSGGRAHVDLLRRDTYRLTATAGIEVAIDGAPVGRGLLGLEEGRHEVTWTGPAGTIRLDVVTCPERGGASGRGVTGRALSPGGSRVTVAARAVARAILAAPFST